MIQSFWSYKPADCDFPGTNQEQVSLPNTVYWGITLPHLIKLMLSPFPLHSLSFLLLLLPLPSPDLTSPQAAQVTSSCPLHSVVFVLPSPQSQKAWKMWQFFNFSLIQSPPSNRAKILHHQYQFHKNWATNRHEESKTCHLRSALGIIKPIFGHGGQSIFW